MLSKEQLFADAKKLKAQNKKTTAQLFTEANIKRQATDADVKRIENFYNSVDSYINKDASKFNYLNNIKELQQIKADGDALKFMLNNVDIEDEFKKTILAEIDFIQNGTAEMEGIDSEIQHISAKEVNNFITELENYTKSLNDDVQNITYENSAEISEKQTLGFESLTAQAEKAKEAVNYLGLDETEKAEIIKSIDNVIDGKGSGAGLADALEALKQQTGVANEEEFKRLQEYKYYFSDENKKEMKNKRKQVTLFEDILDRYERSKWDDNIQGNRIDYVKGEKVVDIYSIYDELKAIGINASDLKIEGDVTPEKVLEKFEKQLYKKYENLKNEVDVYDATMDSVEWEEKIEHKINRYNSGESENFNKWVKDGREDHASGLFHDDLLTSEERTVFNVDFHCYDNLPEEKEALIYKYQDILNRRRAMEVADWLDGEVFLSELYGLAAGIESWGTGIASFFTGDTTPTVSEYASGMIKENLSKHDWGEAWTALYDTSMAVGQQIPSIALAYATGGLSKAFGATASTAQKVSGIVYKASVGTSAAGKAYAEMIRAGYTTNEARAFAALSATSEVMLQELLGGMGKFSGKLTKTSINAIASNIDNAFFRVATSSLISAGGEFIEESLQEVLNPIFKTIVTMDENIPPINWGDVIYSGTIGALTSIAMGAPANIVSGVKTGAEKYINWRKNGGTFHLTSKGIKNLSVSTELYEFANSMPEYTLSYQMANVVRKKGNAYNMLSELAHLNKPLTTEQSQTLHTRLVEDGYSADIATAIVDSAVKVSNGISIPQIQKAAIESNQVLSPTILDTIVQSDVKTLGITEQYNAMYEDATPARNAVYENITKKITPNATQKATETAEKAPATTKTENTTTKGRVALKAPKNSSVKAISNTVLSRAESNGEITQTIADKIGKKLGRTVRIEKQVFETNDNGEKVAVNGYIDKKTGEIVISEKTAKTLYHELTHSGEDTKAYKKLVDNIRKTKVYAEWLSGRTGKVASVDIMEAMLGNKIATEYENKGLALGDKKGIVAESNEEIIADFIADMIFNTKESTLEKFVAELDKPTRNKFIQMVLNFLDKIKNLFAKGDKKLENEIATLERQFVDMLNNAQKETVKQGAKNDNTSGKKLSVSETTSNDTFSRIYEMQGKVNRLSRSIEEIENSSDFKTKISEIFDSNDDIEIQLKKYQQLLDESDYGNLKKQRDALQVELEKLRKSYNEENTNKALKEEKDAIAKSGLSESDYFRKQAVKEFGYTPYFYDAGYITPNGKMLNFSGEKGLHYGSRGQDHRAIGIIYANSEGTDALNRFVKDGNIRIMAESPGIDISTVSEPTTEQYATIRKFASEYANKGFFNVDLTAEDGKVIGSLTYENNINPSRIINDIKHYYSSGEIRQQSDIGRFSYSVENGKKSIFKYSQKEYNNFGWALYDGVLNQYMFNDILTPQLNKLKYHNEYYNKTQNGEYIIPIGKDHGLYNVLVYTNNDPITPKISKIIKLVEEETGYIEDLWRDFLHEKITERNVRTAISYVEDIFGEGYIEQYYAKNSTPFQTYDERKNKEWATISGTFGEGNQRAFKRYDIGRDTDTESNTETERNTERRRYSVESTNKLYTHAIATTDSDGNTLTKAQQKFFKNSELRDDEGHLLKLYHGTQNGGFTKFLSKYSDDGISLFVTSSRELANTYSGSNKNITLPKGKQGLARLFEMGTSRGKGQAGIYEVYANLENPYVLDCKEQSWKNLPFNEKIEGKAIVIAENIFDAEAKTLSVKVTIDGKAYEKTFDFKNVEAKNKYELRDKARQEISDYYNSITGSLSAENLTELSHSAMLWDKKPQTYRGIIDTKTGETDYLTTRVVSKWAKDNGYDGVVFKNVYDVGGKTEVTDIKALLGDVVVVFDGSQIKSVDNTNPTSDPDMRYSVDTDTKMQPFAQRTAKIGEGKVVSYEARQAYKQGYMPKSVWTKEDIVYAVYEKNPKLNVADIPLSTLTNYLKKVGTYKTGKVGMNTDFYGITDDSVKRLANDYKDILKNQITKKLNNPSEEPVQEEAEDLTPKNTIDSEISRNALELGQQLREGKITDTEFQEKMNNLFVEAGKKFGTMEKGESVTGNETFEPAVPKKADKNLNLKRFVRTTYESNNNTDLNKDLTAAQQTDILTNFDLYYTPTSNKANIKEAIKKVKDGEGRETWRNIVNGNKMPTSADIAFGELLLESARAENNAGQVLQYTAELAEMGTRMGQAVQALSLLKRMGGLGQLYYVQQTVNTINRDIEKRFKNKKKKVEINEDLAIRLAQSKTDGDYAIAYEAILRDIASQVPSTFMDKWNAWRYMAMLANPITIIRNVAGNLSFAPVVMFSDVMSKSSQKFLSVDKRTRTFVVSKKYKEFAEKNFQENRKAIMSGGKYNISNEVDSYRRIFKTVPLESVRKLTNWMLENKYFGDGAFIRKYYTRAMGEFLEAQKIDLNNISKEALAKAQEHALKIAQKNTYRDTSFVAQKLSELSRKKGVGIFVEGVLPFKKTPINVFKRGVEYSPLGLVYTTSKALEMVKNKEWSTATFIDGLASTLTGTGLFVLGMWLSAMGVASAGFDDEDEMWKKLQGKQEYSLDFGGVSYTFDWMAPAGVPFFMGSAVYEDIQRESNGNVSIESIFKSVGAALDVMTETSMLQGISDLITNFRFAESGTDAMVNILSSSASSYIMQHFPTLAGKIANTIDDTRREYFVDKTKNAFEQTLDAIGEKISAKIPGVSSSRLPYVNAFGEEEKTGSVAQRIFHSFVSPGYLSQDKSTDVTDAISSIYKVTGDANVLPTRAPKKIKFKGITKNLSEDEYYEYATVRGQKNADYLEEFVNSKDYSELSVEQQAEIIKDLYAFSDAYAKSLLNFTYEDIVAMDVVNATDIDKASYDGYSESTKTALAKAYFLKSYGDEVKIEKNGGSVVEYYIEQALKKAKKPKKEKDKASVEKIIKDYA